MNEEIVYRKNARVEKTIAKLFVFFLPINMFSPLRFLINYTYGLAYSSSFLFFVLGFIFITLRGKITISNSSGGGIFKQFVIMWFVCDFTSIIMAIFLHNQVGTIGGEDTLSAVVKKILFTFAYILFVFYGIEVWKLLSKDEITLVITKSIDFCIIVGLIQVFVVNKVSFAVPIFDLINQFDAFPSSEIIRTKKIALLSNEPAHASSYLCSFAIPFLLSKIIYNHDTSKTLVRLLLCIILLYFTRSTTGYALFIIEMAIFTYVYLTKTNIRLSVKLTSTILVSCFLIIVLLFISHQSTMSSNISSVFDKLLSSDNATSADRKLFIIVDTRIFVNYPLFGVGNGNQGFFYQQFTPNWMLSLYTVAHAYSRAGTALFDGGPFWLAFISGYGIVGMLLLFLVVKNSISIIKCNRDKVGFLYIFYYLNIFTIFANGAVATMGSSLFMWLIFALPMALEGVEKNERKVDGLLH